ncbi:MAG TPA: hemerythrin domain-containing protein [Terriglobales bacterium]|nr:hemerythrin domain-containing protein [Terriglobales bacterium]
MLRDKSLVPLSRQHQHALALCVRIDRALQAGEVDLEAWQAEIQQIVEQEIELHFAAEEKEVFPLADSLPEVQPLVAELKREHETLRAYFAKAMDRGFGRQDLATFGETLSQHIRKEERQLFETMQARLGPEAMSKMGEALDRALAERAQACIVPNERTRLRPKAELP